MRNRDGMLTVEALKAGEREQYAVARPSGQHVVTLHYRAMPGPRHYVVCHRVRSADFDTVEEHTWFFASIDDARRLWRARIRKHTKA